MGCQVILRVWVADRPGSLGRLATRLGELRCDLIGIDVLERDGDRAIDELTVEMPDGFSSHELVAEVSALSGVEVEDLRDPVSRLPHTDRDAMEAAVVLAECRSAADLPETLARVACAAFACDWAAILDTGQGPTTVTTVVGQPPNPHWLGGFVGGVSASGSVLWAGAAMGPRDVAWATLDGSEFVIVVGRDGPPFRARERRQLQQLCRIADARWMDLVLRDNVGARVTGQRRNGRLAVS